MVDKISSGKKFSLVIVESPAKARTIGRFWGDGYVVEASVWHIRDLPRVAGEIPAQYRKEKMVAARREHQCQF